MLLSLFAIAINDLLSKSITGDTFELFDVNAIGISKDLLPDISFVSLIVDATILHLSKSKFSFNGMVVFVVD